MPPAWFTMNQYPLKSLTIHPLPKEMRIPTIIFKNDAVSRHFLLSCGILMIYCVFYCKTMLGCLI